MDLGAPTRRRTADRSCGHEGTVVLRGFSPTPARSDDRYVPVLAAAGSQEPFVAGAHETYISEARFDQSGTHLVTTGDDKLTVCGRSTAARLRSCCRRERNFPTGCSTDQTHGDC